MQRQTNRPTRRRRRLVGLIALAFVAAAALAVYSACIPDGTSKPQLHAKKITSRQDLIGGPTALGEIGDYLIENDKIRVIVEDVGYASGSGLFGGSLIDADRIHQNGKNTLHGGNGQDTFGEFFPAYFLEMVDPQQVQIVNDGSDGKAAVIEVSGRGGEFVTMLRFINQAMINSYDADLRTVLAGTPANSDGEPLVTFTVRYILEPGASHIRVESTVKNVSGEELEFPNGRIVDLIESFMGLDLNGFSVPLGAVLGFGKLNHLFVPDIGYDLRWGLEDSYKKEIELPAFPGKVANFVASSNTHGTNYGFIAGDAPERNFVHNKQDIYGDEATDDMLMLFYASGFGGVLTHDMPQTLADGESYTYTNYLIVGEGDVASILDEAFKIRDVATHKVAGRIFDQQTGSPVGKNVSLLVYRPRPDVSDPKQGCTVDGEGADAKKPLIYSQAYTNSEGYFEFTLPEGHYCYRTRDGGRPLSDYVGFDVGSKPTYLRVIAKSAATFEAHIFGPDGNPMPGKLMLVGTHEYKGDMLKRHYLYDLEAGEPWRTSDMVPDEPGDSPEAKKTRRYLEAIAYGAADGIAKLRVRPGKYNVYVSHGTEYELVGYDDPDRGKNPIVVDLKPGQMKRMSFKLDHVVDTTGYLSGDFHMHARGSIDSGLDFNDRVISIAAEGVEAVVSSDHNHVSDYEPYILRNDLQPWLNSVVGTELTTFEFGHFNAFPLDYEVGSINGGSVPWQRLPPQKIFDELRNHGSLPNEDPVIQVNHPRDSILGYFGQYNVDPFSTEVSLEFQESSDLVATLSTSSGNAFMRNCEEDGTQCRGDKPYESTFSWDFDAIEIFNGKHLELLRHYRIPYGAGEWPQDVAAQLIETTCTEDYSDELDQFCADNGIASADCVSPLDGHDISEWCPFGLDELSQRYPKGSIMCDGNTAAYAGGLDDWYNLLNYPRDFVRGDDMDPGAPVYKRYTATGNSDSHAAGKPEFNQPGSPRNYFWVGHDDPQKMRDRELVDAMKNHHNIVSNGPFAFMTIGDAKVGDQAKVDESKVDIHVVVRAADWVGANRFRIIANGEPLDVQDDATPTVYDFDLDDNGEFETTVSADLEKDTWFVLEVTGDQSLFPAYPPQEIPQVAFDAAIGSIAGSFGFGGGVEGLSPDETFRLTPFAFTNPIWVVHDQGSDTDGEFTPPEPPVASCSEGQFQPGALIGAGAINRKKHRLDAVTLPFQLKRDIKTPLDRKRGDMRDVRTLFKSWHSH